MSKLIQIYITKESVSDDLYKITTLHFESGSQVCQGDLIGSLETSKADIDIESPDDGYVYYRLSVGAQVKVGDIFAVISDEPNASQAALLSVAQPIDEVEVRISKPAARLIEANQIDIAVFKGQKLIEKQDVEKWLKNGSNSTIQLQRNHQDIIIIGGGGHTKVCIDLLRQMSVYQISGIVYTKFAPREKQILGIPILGGMDCLPALYQQGIRYAVIGVGGLDSATTRQEMYLKIKQIGFQLPNLVHPKSIIEPSTLLGEGNQIMAGAILGSEVTIGNNCIINSGVIVSHDTTIGDHVHLAPGAIIAGGCSVGSYSLIGMGVTILYRLTIGKHVTIQNGVNVFNNVIDYINVKH